MAQHMLVNEWVVWGCTYVHLFKICILLTGLIKTRASLGFCLDCTGPPGLIDLILFTKQLKSHSMCLVMHHLFKKFFLNLQGSNWNPENLINIAEKIQPSFFFSKLQKNKNMPNSRNNSNDKIWLEWFTIYYSMVLE
jgi:hypothetical protein